MDNKPLSIKELITNKEFIHFVAKDLNQQIKPSPKTKKDAYGRYYSPFQDDENLFFYHDDFTIYDKSTGETNDSLKKLVEMENVRGEVPGAGSLSIKGVLASYKKHIFDAYAGEAVQKPGKRLQYYIVGDILFTANREMFDNWYAAYLSAHKKGTVVSIPEVKEEKPEEQEQVKGTAFADVIDGTKNFHQEETKPNDDLGEEDTLFLEQSEAIQIKVSEALSRGAQVYLINDSYLLAGDPLKYTYVYSQEEAKRLTKLNHAQFTDHLKFADKKNRYVIKLVCGTIRHASVRIKILMREPFGDMEKIKVFTNIKEAAIYCGIPYYRAVEDIRVGRQALLHNADTSAVYQFRRGDVEWKKPDETEWTLFSENFRIRNYYATRESLIPRTTEHIPYVEQKPEELFERGRKQRNENGAKSFSDLGNLFSKESRDKREAEKKKTVIPTPSPTKKPVVKVEPVKVAPNVTDMDISYRHLSDLETYKVNGNGTLINMLSLATANLINGWLVDGEQIIVVNPWGERLQFKMGTEDWKSIADCKPLLHPVKFNY